MIQCMPKSVCSWDFNLDGDGHHADLEFNWAGEQGTVTADATPFDVRKDGLLSGHWTLVEGGEGIATAQKASALTRSFEVRPGVEPELLLRPVSMFSRSFLLERLGDPVAAIDKVHAFTRRARIEALRPDCEFVILAFSFWLTVLMWRRAARSN